MANHPSAIKRHRQSIQRRERNRAVKSLCRTAIKKTLSAIEGKDTTQAEELLKKTEQTLATAARKGIYHKKNASRKISRLTKRVAKAKKSAK